MYNTCPLLAMILQDSIVVSLTHNECILKWCCARCKPFNFFSSPSPVDIVLTKCRCHAGKRFKSTAWAFFNTLVSCVCAHLKHWQEMILTRTDCGQLFLLQNAPVRLFLSYKMSTYTKALRDHFGHAAISRSATWYPFLASRWKLSGYYFFLVSSVVPCMMDDLLSWLLNQLSCYWNV